MRILFFSKTDLHGRDAFRSYYILQNLKTVKAISLIYLLFSIAMRLIFFAFNLQQQTNHHLDEYSIANWIAIFASPLFYIASLQIIKHFTNSNNYLRGAQLLVFLFALFIIISAMRASFFSMHNPRNTLLMYLVGLILVSTFFTFEYYETIIITIITGVTFSCILPVYQHSFNEQVLNNLASLILLITFFSTSRYIFSYRADNFFKILAIEQKNLEIENASYAKNEILGVVAHDLRNPLAVIKSITMLMEMDAESGADYHENLQMIQTSCDKASSIINDLLETAQNENDDFELEKTELIQFIGTIVEEWLKNKRGQVNIKYNNPARPVHALLHKEKMQRVMDNLIINAIKFSGASDHIEVSVEEVNNKIVITVRDFGIGIPDDLLPYIFDRFSKARRNGVRGEASVGLGLSIVRQIIQKHNGEIDATSTSADGTTFTIQLPRLAG